MATLNIGMKVNRAISGATTVSANSYAKVDYVCGASPAGLQFGSTPQGKVITRVFGPGQSIPLTFTTQSQHIFSPGGDTLVVNTWTLLSGVEIINTI